MTVACCKPAGALNRSSGGIGRADADGRFGAGPSRNGRPFRQDRRNDFARAMAVSALGRFAWRGPLIDRPPHGGALAE